MEAAGGTADARVIAFDESGTQVASKTYPTTGAYEARYDPIEDLYPAVDPSNLTLQVAVVSGTGKVIPVGSGTANVSNDSTTGEVQFADSLLGGTGGLSAVTHDASLTADGTTLAPLGIASGQVVCSLNGLHDAVTLAAGANITFTRSGQTLTIAAPGGGGGSEVTSVNGITGAVTVSGSGSATVTTVGNTVTVSSPTTDAGSTPTSSASQRRRGSTGRTTRGPCGS
ncbi:MAG: hypothetical protein LAO05_08600 [Acidobacteriia bacterium]|nr:hypothetical protein [Terriglobia bacterium]